MGDVRVTGTGALPSVAFQLSPINAPRQFQPFNKSDILRDVYVASCDNIHCIYPIDPPDLRGRWH